MDRWARVPGGWQRVPPRACPRCGTAWDRDGPARPGESSTACSCPAAERRRHTVWTCRSCGALAAEGCQDVASWGPATVPAGLAHDLRRTVEAVGDGPDL